MKKNLAPDQAHSFDRSLIVGTFNEIPANIDDMNLHLKINGETVCTWNCGEKGFGVDRFIEEFSKTNTIKMGDYIVPLVSSDNEIKIGDYLEVSGKGLSSLIVKVK